MQAIDEVERIRREGRLTYNWLRVSVGTKSPVRSMAIDKQQLRSWMPA